MRPIRQRFFTLAALAACAACGRKGARPAEFDSATAAALAPPPGRPTPAAPATNLSRVDQFETGLAIGPDHNLIGGVVQRFAGSDTIAVAVHVASPHAGDTVSARLLFGNRTIDSAAHPVGAADTTGHALVDFTFATEKARPAGSYQVEVFLGSASQGSRPITITK